MSISTSTSNPVTLGQSYRPAASRQSLGGQQGVAYFEFDYDYFDELEPALPSNEHLADGTRLVSLSTPPVSRLALVGIAIASACATMAILTLAL